MKLVSLSPSLLVLASLLAAVYGQPTDLCTVCADTSEPLANPQTVFQPSQNTTCTDLIGQFDSNGMASMAADDESCKNLQLYAFQIGCCRNPPFQYCDICPDGSEFRPGRKIPVGQADNPSCAQFEFRKGALLGLFEHGDCGDTQLQRSAFYCGCPDVEQECSLCPNATDTPGKPSKREKFINPGSTCRSLNYLYSIFKKDECDTASFNFGVDLAAFCECPGTEPNGTACELCPDGQHVASKDKNKEYREGITCGDADDYAQYIVREDFCEDVWAPEPRAACCTDGATALFVGLVSAVGFVGSMVTTLLTVF